MGVCKQEIEAVPGKMLCASMSLLCWEDSASLLCINRNISCRRIKNSKERSLFDEIPSNRYLLNFLYS